MEELFKSKDAEITKLLSENRELVDELRQCQADKEFVWSLWKRLQVSSPDLTQAISLIMEREKEKAESKDRKVLEILQTKDEEIKDLQDTVTSLKKDNDKLIELKVNVESERNKVAMEFQQLQSEMMKLRQHIERSDTDNTDKCNSYQRALDDAEDQKYQINQKNTDLLTDIQQMRTKLQSFEDENEQLFNKNKHLENEIRDRDAVLKRIMDEKASVLSNLEDAQRDYNDIKDGALITKKDLKSRDKSYKEIKEAYDQLELHNQHQKQLITQLQQLQTNTKKIAKEQEETDRNEINKLQCLYDELSRNYERLNYAHERLKQENEDITRRVQIQDQALHDTEKELKKSIEMATGKRRDYDDMNLEEQVARQRNEIESLQRRLREKSKRSRRSVSPYNNDDVAEQTFSPIIERGIGRHAPRTRSLSPCAQSRQIMMMQKRLKATETKLDDTKHLLELKKDEVKEIQRAHNKRLERLQMLQSDYRALKSGTNDGDAIRSPKHRRSRHLKSDPRTLRKENSETVWNDLAHYKQENRALLQDRMSVEEELDALRVQAAMDRATIQDLNLCLKNEKDELLARLRPSSHVQERLSSTPKKNKEPKPSRRTTKNLERRLENSLEDNRLLKKDKERLLADARVLKEDAKSLKREITDMRQNGTKFRQENGELRRKVEALKCDNDQLDGETNALRAEIQGLRTENAGVRSENSSLRSENSDLRHDASELKQELADLKDELNDIDQSISVAETQRSKQRGKSAPDAYQRSKPNIAKKHQKFLNKSIQDMQEAFGSDFHPDDLTEPVSTTTMSEDTIRGEGRSDASSLGQSIVRASRKPKGYKRDYDEDKDDDDTLVDESMGNKSGKVSTKRPSSLPRYADSGMQPALKRRLASLQTQCTSLRSAKQNAIKRVNDGKEKNIELQSELTTCQNKLKNMKQSIQRLNREAEVLQREREDLQQALLEARSKQPEPQAHTDADYKYVESKLKQSNTEILRATDQIKDLKKEIENKNEQANIEKEKLLRLERDVGMKRQLIDEMRIKVKEHENRTKDDHNSKLDLQDKLKQIEEDLNHKKNHVESLRRQLQVCTKDKARYETMYNKSREELEKRCEQLSSVQASRLEAENATSRVEQEAEHQLQTLASRSEQALEKLKIRLEKSEEKLSEFATFVQNLSSQLLELLCRQRECLLREKMTQSESQARLNQSGNRKASSMSHAQEVACNILNMSRSDFEDLMAPVDVVKRKSETDEWEEEKVVATQQDKSWKAKVEKIATENPPFAKSLSRLLWDKIQDAVNLAEDKFRLHTEHLEQELLARKNI